MRKFVTIFLAGCSLALTGCCTTRSGKTISDSAPANDVSTASWSVVGQWRCAHPAWKDNITISQDGTFRRSGNDGGRWTLSGLQDHVILILAWKRWPAEVVTMISPDDFQGKVRDGELKLHRISNLANPTK